MRKIRAKKEKNLIHAFLISCSFWTLQAPSLNSIVFNCPVTVCVCPEFCSWSDEDAARLGSASGTPLLEPLRHRRWWVHRELDQLESVWVLLETKHLLPVKSSIYLVPLQVLVFASSADSSRRLLLQCLWRLFSEQPADAVERTANQWIRVWADLSSFKCHFLLL